MPGHDSAWVKMQVTAVMEGKCTEQEAHGLLTSVSAALAAKFEKNIRAARERKERPSAARARSIKTKEANAAERVNALMARINGSYWAGMEGTADVPGLGEVRARVQTHDNDTGKLMVKLLGPTTNGRLVTIHKAQFTKDKHE